MAGTAGHGRRSGQLELTYRVGVEADGHLVLRAREGLVCCGEQRANVLPDRKSNGKQRAEKRYCRPHLWLSRAGNRNALATSAAWPKATPGSYPTPHSLLLQLCWQAAQLVAIGKHAMAGDDRPSSRHHRRSSSRSRSRSRSPPARDRRRASPSPRRRRSPSPRRRSRSPPRRSPSPRRRVSRSPPPRRASRSPPARRRDNPVRRRSPDYKPAAPRHVHRGCMHAHRCQAGSMCSFSGHHAAHGPPCVAP